MNMNGTQSKYIKEIENKYHIEGTTPSIQGENNENIIKRIEQAS